MKSLTHLTHIATPPSRYMAWSVLSRRSPQAPDEKPYVAQIAEHCNYKDSLQEMLRDLLVCGVNHAGIQKCLLAEKDLTLEVALSKA